MWRNFSFLYEFEQFMKFYRSLCRFCSKSMWRKICAEKICVEKKWQIWGLGISYFVILFPRRQSIGRIFPFEVLFSNRSKKLEKNRERISMNKRCSCRAHYFSQFTINIFWSREYLLFLKIPNRGKWSRKLRSMEIWKYGNYTKRQLIQQNCE